MGSLGRIGTSFAVASLLITAPAAADMPAAAETRPTKEGIDLFEKTIRPALVRHCYECHSGDPKKAKGHFVLDTRAGLRKGGDSGAAILPGHAEGSLLLEAIRYEGLEMPPQGKLPDDLIAEFERWVQLGAPDPRFKPPNGKSNLNFAEARKWWSFQRPKAAAAPKVNDAAWPRSDIDRFILARLEQAKLKPVADADRVTLIRRTSYDLTGLPPSPKEIDDFVNDASSDAMARLVDRLLASPRFGERWGRHWLDAVRYGESTGKGLNVPYRYAWRYRDWVIDAFNADKPYDKFIVEQLAGDLLPSRNPSERDQSFIATGFLAIGPKGVNEPNPEQYLMDVVDDQIDVTSRSFLGLTVACARCHDHKFDPIPTTDYYAMAGIFRSTKTLAGVRPGTRSARDKQLLALADPGKTAKPSPGDLEAEKSREQQIAQIEGEIAGLKKQIRQLGKPMKPGKPKGKGKKKPQPGKPNMKQVKLAKGSANAQGGAAKPQASTAKGQPGPAKPRAANAQQLREKIKALDDRLNELEQVATPFKPLAMGVRNADTPSNSKVLLRGDLKTPGPEVPRGTLTVLKTGDGRINPKSSGRMEMAHWIASRDNPLTARVMVNRVWQHLFGKGLVETVDNFGALGDEPSNPALLDALAVQFMNEKWSVKQLIRSIVLSRVYQLSSEHSAENYAVDPANKLLWRMDRRRLDAEEIRDAILAASARLQLDRPESSPMLQLGNGPLGRQDLSPIRKPSPVRSVYLPLPRGIVPDTL
ncbi:MAG TPA: PSD1 and planctomycete cytochrome C domain-containing protein, partial [Pirellulales bacterium]|nr:PSD1 and planctomycete cytochrome C domain-containing protein [Pirellulales bacterium]